MYIYFLFSYLLLSSHQLHVCINICMCLLLLWQRKNTVIRIMDNINIYSSNMSIRIYIHQCISPKFTLKKTQNKKKKHDPKIFRYVCLCLNPE